MDILLAVAISHKPLCEMATNLDVDIAAIEELMAVAGFRSKREAVDSAVREALAYRKQLKARELLATVDFRPVVVDRGVERR